MHEHIARATAEVARGLAERVGALPDLPGPAGRSRVMALLDSILSCGDLPDRTVTTGGDRQARFLALLDPISELADPPGIPRAASSDYLANFVRLAVERGDMPGDKSGRWLGFGEGCVAARGGVLPPGAGPREGDGDLDLFELSYRLGFVQACLAVAGALDVDAERERTRPIFHAAYEASGMAKPATVEVRA